MTAKADEAWAFPFGGFIAFIHGWLFSDDWQSFYLGALFLLFSLLLCLAVIVTKRPNREKNNETMEDPNGVLQNPP